jgi:hypothetical protein
MSELDLAMIWLKNYLCGIKQQSLTHKMMIDFYFWCLTTLSAISWRPVLVVEEDGMYMGQISNKKPSGEPTNYLGI